MNLQLIFKQKNNINYWLYTVILLTLVVSNRFNSIAIIIFIIFNFGTFSKEGILKIISDRLVIITASVFLVYVISFMFSENKVYAIKVLERNISFFLLPAAVFSSIYKRPKFDLKIIIRNFIYIISVLLLFSFVIALVKNFNFNLDNNFPFFRFKSWFFTYHYIASNINISAIYLSLFVSLATCFLMLDLLEKENYKLKVKSKVKWLWLFGLITFLFLLSARTILLTSSLIIYLFLFKYAKAKKKLPLFIIASVISFFSLSIIVYNNDVLRLRVTSAFMFHEDAKYFGGGLSSRFHQWASIFQELLNNNLFYGVSIGDIHEKYMIAYQNFNLEWALENNFNSHNMYLEILFSNGLLGVFVLLFLFIESIRMAFKYRDLKYKLFLVLFMIAGITESLLSRQYGLIYFLIFNSLFYISLKYKTE
tara:strand:- start:2509 stop:3774 length:1266 start_codon:yes stop_codon:yes gene_type:complete